MPHRLLDSDRNAIVDSIMAVDGNAEIYLFGSRTDTNKKGGDIDIIILSDSLIEKDLLKIEKQIFNKIEEIKIDFIISKKLVTDNFVKIILNYAVKLC